jgi:hypothetical protein
MGVAAVAHQLALNACLNKGVFRTAPGDAVPFGADDLEQAVKKWVNDSSDSIKSKFDAALRRHRVRMFDNTRLILAALAVGPLEGMLHGEILADIRKQEPYYPPSNLTGYLRELMTEERGGLIITNPDGRFRFVDPLHHTYAQAVLGQRPATRESEVDWGTLLKSVTSTLIELSKGWIDAQSVTEVEHTQPVRRPRRDR